MTHAAVGALAGRAVAPARPRAALAGALAALVPDADHVLEWSSAADYFLHHRTATHSLVFVAGAALGAAGFRGARPLERAAVVAAGLLTHLLLDLMTPFGTALLWPFSGRMLALDGLPIFAPWVLGPALAAAALALPRPGRVPALLGLGFVTVLVAAEWSVARHAARAVPGGAALAVPDWRDPTVGVAFAVDEASVSRLRIEPNGAARVEWSRPSNADALALLPPHLVSRLRVPVARWAGDAVIVHDAQLEALPIPIDDPPIRLVRDAAGVRVEQRPLGVQPVVWLAVVGLVLAVGRLAKPAGRRDPANSSSLSASFRPRVARPS